MAIYHCSIKIISRGKGKSAVAAAAYRAAETITNEYDGVTHNYTQKGGVVHTEILLPEHAPAEYADRAVLWNAVEKIEKAKNAQLAREIELALPKELSREENISLAREYVREHFVSAGMCADLCIHDKGDGNPHAHVLLTMRPFNEDKTWGDKQRKEYILDQNGGKIYDPKKKQYKCKSVPTTDWNDQTKAEVWRAAWAAAVNAVLERQNVAERVDHRSYERQGVEQIPTVHMGVAATQMERKGIVTERGNMNREIKQTNNLIFAIAAQLKRLKDWLKETLTPVAEPTTEEKPSIMAQLKQYKKEIAETQKLELSPQPSALADLYERYDAALKKLRQVDVRLKSANSAVEYEKILPERHKAYAEYSALRAEVKKAERNLPRGKTRVTDRGDSR